MATALLANSFFVLISFAKNTYKSKFTEPDDSCTCKICSCKSVTNNI